MKIEEHGIITSLQNAPYLEKIDLRNTNISTRVLDAAYNVVINRRNEIPLKFAKDGKLLINKRGLILKKLEFPGDFQRSYTKISTSNRALEKILHRCGRSLNVLEFKKDDISFRYIPIITKHCRNLLCLTLPLNDYSSSDPRLGCPRTGRSSDQHPIAAMYLW
ncbi:hypothetical protein PV326_003286 [Microctonus aethiopoides]|nr:hypothetical protein PV326_003286 [Microctonus aethiopoides]